jgi:hypothetical protein
VPSNIPSMRNLMEDPTYRAYMKRMPPRLHANKSGKPWQLWVDRGAGRWGTTFRATYEEVWKLFVHHYKESATDHRDVTIVSRRVFWAPPGEWYLQKVRRPRRPTPDDPSPTKITVENRWRQTFFWDAIDLHWCGRCRRPVYWLPLFDNHHALRRQPAVADEDNFRCLICGIRWIATPDISQMVKIEREPS